VVHAPWVCCRGGDEVWVRFLVGFWVRFWRLSLYLMVVPMVWPGDQLVELVGVGPRWLLQGAAMHFVALPDDLSLQMMSASLLLYRRSC